MEGATCPFVHLNGANTPNPHKWMDKGMETPTSTSSSGTSMESVARSGFLKKKRTFGRWKERWYVLSSGALAEYKFKSDKALKALSEWNVRDILRLEDADNITGASNTFVLYFKDSALKPLFFQAGSKGELQEWKTDLQKVIDCINTPREDNKIHLDAFNDPVVLSDDKAVIIDLNQPAIDLFGYTKEEAIGQNVTIFIPDALAVRHEAYVTDYIRTNQRRLIGMPRKMNARKSDGSIFPIILSLGEMFSEGKRRFIATMRDISEEESDFANQKLIESLNLKVDKMAEKVKQEFVSTTKEMAKIQHKLKEKKDALKKENTELQNELAGLSRELAVEKKSREIATVALASLMFDKIISSEDGVLEGIKNLITDEVNSSTSLTTVFREDTPNTKKISAFMFVTGADYLTHILEHTVHRIIKKKRVLEISPLKIEGTLSPEEKDNTTDTIRRRQRKLVKHAQKILHTLLNTTDYFPEYFREMFMHLKSEIMRKFPADNSGEFADGVVVSFLFLRFIVPVVIRPDAYALVRQPIPENSQRTLLYVGKILQHLANGVLFTEDEMGPMNDFINTNKDNLHFFVQSSIGRKRRSDSENSFASMHSFHSHQHAPHSQIPHSPSFSMHSTRSKH